MSNLFENISKIFDFAVKNEANIDKVLRYLVRFGYLDQDSETGIEDILNAISTLHSTVGSVNPNGIIGPQTLQIMTLPRCGCRDVQKQTEGIGQLNKWGINNLTYYLDGYDDMGKDLWSKTCRSAFDEVELVCNLKFTEVFNVNTANFIFGLGKGTRDQFDGPSGVLAWNELPPTSNFTGQLQGKADIDENWLGLGQTGRGILFKNVFGHEVGGHGCGLSHTNTPNSLMNPFYSVAIDKPQADDIKQLQARYGKPVQVPGTVPSNPSIPQNPDELVIRISGQATVKIDGYKIIKA